LGRSDLTTGTTGQALRKSKSNAIVGVTSLVKNPEGPTGKKRIMVETKVTSTITNNPKAERGDTTEM
jgi:hypothetical protein